eukprot:6721116-Alexandrium_andersonii.AAC.1
MLCCVVLRCALVALWPCGLVVWCRMQWCGSVRYVVAQCCYQRIATPPPPSFRCVRHSSGRPYAVTLAAVPLPVGADALFVVAGDSGSADGRML